MPRCYHPNELTIDFSSFGLNMFKFALRNPRQVRSWERRGDVGTWFWWTKFGLHVQAWKPHVQFGVLLSKGTQFPRSLSITQRCENRQETQVSTTIGHPEPHDLWGHRANIRHDLPLFTLFLQPSPREEHTGSSRTLSEGQGLLSIAAGCPAGLLTSSLLIQLFMEESCSFQLISPRKPPRNTSSIIL